MSPPESIDAPHAGSPEDAIAAAASMIEQGRWREAIERIAPLLEADPADPEANLVKGLAEAGLGRLDDAERSLRRSIDADPGSPLAWESLAAVLERLGDLERSAEARLEAWRRAPEDARLAAVAAGALFNAGRLDAAVEPARAAADLAAAQPAYKVRLAELLAVLDRRDEALEVFDRLLARFPALSAVRLARGVAALPSVPSDGAELERAMAAFRAALDPCSVDADSDRSIDATTPGLAPTGLELFGDAGPPWPFLRAAWCEPDPHAARRFAAAFAASASASVARSTATAARRRAVWPPASGSRRVRVGIVSGLWFEHVVARLFLEGWIRHLDRSRFEVIAIDVGRRHDAFGEALLAQADRVERGVRPFSAWASTIESLACDAILWPEIGIEPVATRLAALRFAPVQAMAWGHPESSGLASIDAFLSGDAMEPKAAATHYAESLVRLPRLGSWIARPTMPTPADRASLAWSESTTVFWCRADAAQASPALRCALRLDRRRGARGAVRVLASAWTRDRGGSIQGTTRSGVQGRGRRTCSATRVPAAARHRRRFAARLAAADLFLDPPGWSGGHTTLEAIAAGVPVLTLPGAFMRRRHAHGILATIDPEATLAADLVATDEQDYVRRAIDLARGHDRRRRLASSIAAASDRVFDDAAPIRALEDWLQQAVREGNA